MSIGSVVSNSWTPPFWRRSTDGLSGATVSTPPPDASGTAQSNNAMALFSPTTSETGIAATSAANPFQQLSSDIQAMLVQAQGGIAMPAASTTATAATSTEASAVVANG